MRPLCIGVCSVAATLCCLSAGAFTLVFDDIPANGGFDYYITEYGIAFSSAFRVADSSEFNWGIPHSGTKVLAFSQDFNSDWEIVPFKKAVGYGYEILYAHSVGAYFSTAPGAVVEMLGYSESDTQPVANVVIGSSSGAWSDHYAEISSASSDISWIMFRAVSSSDALHGFYADDMNIVPVPEPSSLATLAVGLAPLAAAKLRRRRRTA